MVDIVDVLVARALTPQGEIDTYAAKARQAVTQANAAVQEVEDAAELINDTTQSATELAETTRQALADAQQARQEAETAISEISDAEGTVTEIAQDEIDNLLLSLTSSDVFTDITKNLRVSYPSGNVETINNLVKMYKAEGQNEDGTMTQKAITKYVADVKDELEEEIAKGGGSGSIDLGEDNAGNVVIVGPDGNITSGEISEQEIIDALIKSDSFIIEGTLGLEIDYENKTFTRLQDAAAYTIGDDFTQYAIYGGRKRCNVSDNGAITAFYGDINYREDGTNGQVMVYQPKFYYKRVPVKTAKNKVGSIVRKEILLISPTKQVGFKLHPLFINEDNEEVEYVLLSAYNGSVYDISSVSYNLNDASGIDFDRDMLSSIGGAKPVSGVNNQLTSAAAEKLAKNRGAGWHITTMAAQSAEQMLEMVEFGGLNTQNAIENGVTNISGNTTSNCSSLTGSTPENGAADITINEIDGSQTSYNTVGRRAISYRGVENPWGNIWNFIGDIIVNGNGSTNGGVPYICKNFNYSTSPNEDYASIGFSVPGGHNWVSAMGYGDEEYDWVYMPAEISGANSALPVGDSLWSVSNLNTNDALVVGGAWNTTDEAGSFYYGCDRGISYYARNFGARLIFLPKKNLIYQSNLDAWTARFGE